MLSLDKCTKGYTLEEIQTNHWIQNLIITRLPLTIWEGKYCMGDNWCKSHVLKKDNPNFHFSKYLISKIILKSFSSMIRARAETCQKCKLFLFCANTRLIYRKIFSKCECWTHWTHQTHRTHWTHWTHWTIASSRLLVLFLYKLQSSGSSKNLQRLDRRFTFNPRCNTGS